MNEEFTQKSLKAKIPNPKYGLGKPLMPPPTTPNF